MFKFEETGPSRRKGSALSTGYALLAAAVLSGAMAGCGTTQAPTTPASTPTPGSVAPKQTLIEEQRRLAELFKGTPVVFTMQADGGLRVEIPLQYCFDAGQAKIKPPLAAVLDRVARSQARETTHLSLTAPADPGAKNQALGIERAVGMRRYMVDRGVAEARFLAVAVSASGVLRIVVTNVPAS